MIQSKTVNTIIVKKKYKQTMLNILQKSRLNIFVQNPMLKRWSAMQAI